MTGSDGSLQVVVIETDGLGDRSYLVHDGEVGVVVDPQRDIDRVLSAIDDAGVSVGLVLETHLHNDYVTGGLELAARTGAQYVVAAAEEVGFERRPVADGDVLALGRVRIRALATPGHTPHHLSYAVGSGDVPELVLTGGSLLFGTVGRTDLIDAERTEELSRSQYRSARRLADELHDDVVVLPTHGFGSFCSSAASSGADTSSIGKERAENLALTVDDEDDFVQRLLSGLTAYPRYYAHMGAINRHGPAPLDLSPPEPADAAELRRRIEAGEWVVDLRDRRAFAKGHVAGTVGVELGDPFATYLGWVLPWGTPVTLLGDTSEQVAEAQRAMVRIGIDRPAGAATDPEALAGTLGTGRYEVSDFPGLADQLGEPSLVVLDVRRDDERASGAIESSVHVPLQDLEARVGELPDGRLWVHCASGFRASIAASLLDRAGRDVVLIDDAWERAPDAGLPVMTDGAQEAP